MTSYRDLAMVVSSQDDNHANNDMGVLFRGNVNNIVKKFAQHASQNNHHPRESKTQSNQRGQPSINSKNTTNNSNNDISTSNSADGNNNQSSTSVTTTTQQTTPAANVANLKINTNSKVNNNVRSPNTAIKRVNNQQDTSTPDLFKVKLKKVGIEKLLQKDDEHRKTNNQDQQMNDNNGSQSWTNTFDIIKPNQQKTNDGDNQHDQRSSDPLPNTNRQQQPSYQRDNDNIMPTSLNDSHRNSPGSIRTQNKMPVDNNDGDDEEDDPLPPPPIKRNQKSDITNPSSDLSDFTKANYVPPPAPAKHTDPTIEPKVNNNPTSLSQKSKSGSGSLIYNFAKTGKKKNQSNNNVQPPNKLQNDKSSYNFRRTAGSKADNNQPPISDSVDDATTDAPSSFNATKKSTTTNSFSNFAKKKSKTATPQNSSELQINQDQNQPSSPKSNLKSSSNSEGKAHVNVTFSDGQPQIDYTHSADEYERVIDIDAGLNAAQFEVEKSLRNMDLITVELPKCK